MIRVYKNGNYMVLFNLSNGTRIRSTIDKDATEFIPEFAENMDIKITNRCTGTNCAWCHEGSSSCGKHADLNEPFIDTLKPYQEVALGGGNVLEHPDLLSFLKKLKNMKVIANITLNQIHFEQNYELVKRLADEHLIYGLGVSLVDPTDEFISKVKQFPNAVIHVINGVLSKRQAERLYDKGLKILILGYKHLRRGNDWYKESIEVYDDNYSWLYNEIGKFAEHFEVVSFDNLAISQLAIRRLLTDGEWDKFYAGDDGTHTYYIDMVNRQFAKSSTAPFDKRYDLLDDVVEMFDIIRTEESNV